MSKRDLPLRTGHPEALELSQDERMIFHCDQGGEYTGEVFAAACKRAGVRQSMGRTGSCLLTAVAESFNFTLEFELLAGNHFTTRRPGRR